MGQHDGGGPVVHGGLDDQPGVHKHPVQTALRQPTAGQHPALGVQTEQVEQFALCSEKIGQQIFACVLHGADLVLVPGPGGQVAAHDLGKHGEVEGGVLTHALDLPQILRGGVQYGGEGAEVVDEPVGQRVHIALRHGIEQHQLQKLVVVKNSFAVVGKALLQTLTVPLMNGHDFPSF